RKKEEKITITRAMIKIKSVKGYQRDEDGNWEYFIDPKNKIAYVRITSFVGPTDTNANRATGGTVYELREAMTKLQKEGMKSLILDLRFNPGGLLISATQTVDMFVEKGIIISRKGRVGPNVVIKATKKDTISDVPIVVLISSFSASGAEILAGALADHNRAILVGERTYGKGSVQDVVYLDDGNNGKAALKLTTSKYYLPNGVCIHREKGMTKDDEWGVNPHITVKMSPMEYAQILSARREADVILGNDHDANAEDKEPAGDEEKKPEEPKDSSGETTEAPSPDEPKAEPGDRQLQRALDVLRAMDVMKSYLKAG
ncbi:MAG: S41 family peptidase, partial [Phycisphaerae bacterium]|nr:S41 family peptidase [Phycisphaerae bacterium]